MKYSELSVEEELQELNRRAEEMGNNPSVCIPHGKIREMLKAKIG